MTDSAITSITYDRRRAVILVAEALVAGTVATALAIAANPAVCLMPDPIFAAIDIHKKSAAALEAVFAGAPTVIDLARANETQRLLPPAMIAERGALKDLAGVSPTTSAGQSALADYAEVLKVRTLWGRLDPGADLIAGISRAA